MTPSPRLTPQEILSAIDQDEWECLRKLDGEASVLVDLWDSPPAEAPAGSVTPSLRTYRLLGGMALLGKGFCWTDARGSALDRLLDWPVSEQMSVLEETAWVEAIQALAAAGHLLSYSPTADFETWAGKDPWARLAGNPSFYPIALRLLEKGDVAAYVPAQPQWRSWPCDPTSALMEGWGATALTQAWIFAIAQGYPLAGRQGSDWLARAPQWDLQGTSIRQALATGQVDVHCKGSSGHVPLEVWMEEDNISLCSPAALLVLLEHDITVLDDLDKMERPLVSQVMEFMEFESIHQPAEELDMLHQKIRAYRLKGHLSQSLAGSSAETDSKRL